FELDSSPELFDREWERFSRSLVQALEETSVRTHRDQDRSAETARGLPELGSAALPAVPGAFRNTPDTDVSTAANQEWADLVTRRSRGAELGIEEAAAARVEDLGGVEEAISAALAAQRSWGTLGMEKRAMVLRRVARMLAGHRAELLEVMASETGRSEEHTSELQSRFDLV